MKFLFLISTLLLTSSIFAQNRQPRYAQERQAQRLVDQMAQLAPQNLSVLSEPELGQLIFQLTEARNTLLSLRSPSPLPPRGPRPAPRPRPNPRDEVQLRCTSRDDDNRAPWVLSYVDLNFSVIKLNEVLFSSSSSCEESLKNKKYVLGATLSCTNRDGDNRPPYSMIKFIDRQVSKLSGQNFSSLSNCFTAIEQSRTISSDEIAFCIDRDADNRSPYVMKKLNVVSGFFSQLNTNSFRSLADCERVLMSR